MKKIDPRIGEDANGRSFGSGLLYGVAVSRRRLEGLTSDSASRGLRCALNRTLFATIDYYGLASADGARRVKRSVHGGPAARR